MTIILRYKINENCKFDYYESNVKHFVNKINVNINNNSNFFSYIDLKRFLKHKNELDIYNEIKSSFCLFCVNQIEDLPNNDKISIIKLPCKCCFCSRKCLFKYFEFYARYKKINFKHFNYDFFCFCGFRYNVRNLLSLTNILLDASMLENHNKNDIENYYDCREFLKKYFNLLIDKKFQNNCFYCGLVLRDDVIRFKVLIRDSVLKNENLLNNHFFHMICYGCIENYSKNIINIDKRNSPLLNNKKNKMKYFLENSSLQCHMCNTMHFIKNIEEIDKNLI